MKIAGWICLVFGVLGLIGAILSGNGGWGPIFWIAVGTALLYVVSSKKQDTNQDN